MHIACFCRDDEIPHAYEEKLFQSLKIGARVHGDPVDIRALNRFKHYNYDFDVACVLGLSGATRKLIDACNKVGVRVVVLDKGILRKRNKTGGYFRFYIDDGSPMKYLMRTTRPSDRFENLNIDLQPFEESYPDAPIIFADNSKKVNEFWKAKEPLRVAKYTLTRLHEITARPIVYRPKPKSKPVSLDLPFLIMSHKPDNIEDALVGAHVLITYYSATSVNAIIAGVPVIVLGTNAAEPVANKSLNCLEDLWYPTDEVRWQWFCNLAYSQWTGNELTSGEAWYFIRGELKATDTETKGARKLFRAARNIVKAIKPNKHKEK